MRTDEILNKAADVMEQRGHSKLFFDSPFGVCAAGAIGCAIAGSWFKLTETQDRVDAAKTLDWLAKSLGLADRTRIVDWNQYNHISTITAGMRAAATLYRAQHADIEQKEEATA